MNITLETLDAQANYSLDMHNERDLDNRVSGLEDAYRAVLKGMAEVLWTRKMLGLHEVLSKGINIIGKLVITRTATVEMMMACLVDDRIDKAQTLETTGNTLLSGMAWCLYRTSNQEATDRQYELLKRLAAHGGQTKQSAVAILMTGEKMGMEMRYLANALFRWNPSSMAAMSPRAANIMHGFLNRECGGCATLQWMSIVQPSVVGDVFPNKVMRHLFLGEIAKQFCRLDRAKAKKIDAYKRGILLHRAATVCVGLAELDLPALVVTKILDRVKFVRKLIMADKWTVVKMIKQREF